MWHKDRLVVRAPVAAPLFCTFQGEFSFPFHLKKTENRKCMGNQVFLEALQLHIPHESGNTGDWQVDGVARKMVQVHVSYSGLSKGILAGDVEDYNFLLWGGLFLL